ncbi:MDR family oxidoreductase [Jeongeupia naejangsanensis]|uniref:Oxidoreductase n=1 Tax=Jeongeupia naejangsanensis TaxID=613195 RepID=A0ABS2BJA9_9NEIS|nr:MDR family oxidoreductase [Jeongeupia naejangsanensis]MBM3114919.1 oxidoreductase [Jeongeupia naejangsanensis]
MFKAVYLTRDGEFKAQLAELDEARLPASGVTLRVDYSTLNYKDALALTDSGPVVRQFPMVAGVDAVGTVLESDSLDFAPGEKVILNGWGCGETTWGALAQRARVPAEGLVRLPSGLSAHDAMALGTAGYTAMLCVQALKKHGLTPGVGPVLVTGATGGVGSVAVMLLAKLGFEVVAVTGKVDAADYLRTLGAAEVIDRTGLSGAGKPLQKERWAGVVDSVGSHVLANACAQVRRDGAVAACGLAGGMDFPATVAPFILRGVTLYGVDSVYAPRAQRQEAWDLLAGLIDPALLASASTEIGLADTFGAAADIIAGRHRGRFIVDVNR